MSLGGVEFEESASGTELTYTEQDFFFDSGYGADSRTAGTDGLLDQFAAYVARLG